MYLQLGFYLLCPEMYTSSMHDIESRMRVELIYIIYARHNQELDGQKGNKPINAS